MYLQRGWLLVDILPFCSCFITYMYWNERKGGVQLEGEKERIKNDTMRSNFLFGHI